jgi:hypothetical protein
MLTVDATQLYEQFLAARERAIAVSDRYAACKPGDPSRAQVWDSVMRETETARSLLERWLRSGSLTERSAGLSETEPRVVSHNT